MITRSPLGRAYARAVVGRRLALLLVATAAACSPGATPDTPAAAPLTFLGEAIIDTVPAVPGAPPVGGLSSLFRVEGDRYYAVSDDRGEHGPARYYVLRIDLTADRLAPGGARVEEWRSLLGAGGEALEEGTFDLEGLVALDDHLVVSSEGDASAGIAPFVALFGADGRFIESFALPAGFDPAPDGSAGVRNNMALEALAVGPQRRFLFTANEGPLAQDGPLATPQQGGLVRLLRFDRARGVFEAQFAYPIDRVHAASPTGGTEVNGIVELLALSDTHLLALERSFAAGASPEHAIKLFDVCLEGATDISGVTSLAGSDADIAPAGKRLIANLADLVPRLDNVEGMTFGPPFEGGEPTLLFVSDDNFAPHQLTQVLAFAVAPGAFGGCGAG